jgi:hypothetical protein
MSKPRQSNPAPSAPASGDGADDLAILYPERRQTIAGVAITMREYGFIEGVQLAPLVEAVVGALADVASAGDRLTPSALRPAFAAHPDAVVALIAAASDQPEAWVRALSDRDGQALMLLWWVTNADFFVRRVIEAVTVRQMEKASAGQTSTPASSVPGTTPGGSVNTRAGS